MTPMGSRIVSAKPLRFSLGRVSPSIRLASPALTPLGRTAITLTGAAVASSAVALAQIVAGAAAPVDYRSFGAVSYTHLDVYKRQIQMRLQFTQVDFNNLIKIFFRVCVNFCISGQVFLYSIRRICHFCTAG